MSRYKPLLGILILVVALVAGACSPQERAREEARRAASDRQYFVMKNDVEYKNYDRRLKIADDPTTILWCTSAFPIPSSPLFTIPIVGKITSGGKRPFPDDPGPDAMYGTSGDYRYGFSPVGTYHDWYNMSLYCTNEPTVWQRESTELVMQLDPTLLQAHEQARAALGRGDLQQAMKLLQDAINKVKKGGK